MFEKNKKMTSILGSIVLFLMMVVLFWNMAGAETLTRAEIEKWLGSRDSGPVIDLSDYQRTEGDPVTMNEYANEAEPLELTHSIFDLNVCSVTFKLTWTDEEDTGWIGSAPNHENQPDKFLLKISSPDTSIHGEASGSNAIGKSGLIEATIPVPVREDPAYNGTGDWNITIIVDAGDHMPRYKGLFRFNDVGNDFELEITHQYYIPKDE